MLHIPSGIIQDMIAHARELAPHECCGMLSGKDGTVNACYRITNILAAMTKQELSRFEGAKLSDLQRLSPESRRFVRRYSLPEWSQNAGTPRL